MSSPGAVMDLSIIIPAYNEESRIDATLDLVLRHLRKAGLSFEVIVVDDGSTDRTAAAVSGRTDAEVRLLGLERNRGKGAAVREGMLSASGTYRFFVDADLSTPIGEIDRLLGELRNGTDVCLGSRGLDERLVKRHQPWYRETMGKIFNRFVRLLVLRGVADSQCGFKGFREAAARAVFSRSRIDRFSFDVEVIYLARRYGLAVKEMPVEWYNDPRTTVNPLTDASRMLWDLLRIRWLHRRDPA